MKTVAEEWRTFRGETVLKSPEIEAEMKLAFFAGCGACMKLVHDSFKVPEAEGRAQVAQIAAELRDFIEAHLKQEAETKTKAE